MHSNLLMYLTAMSAVSIHNLVNNLNEITRNANTVELRTLDTNWTLDNEANLVRFYPHCKGEHQSPINIETSSVEENTNLRLGLTAYDKPISGFVSNEFPTFRLVPFSFVWPRPNAVVGNSMARSFNPYADSHYTLSFVEFYWSQADQGRSAIHQIDGQDHPLEIHFVHLNTAYTNIDEALIKPNGLLILAVMAVPSTHESYILDKLLDDLNNITSHGQQVVVEEDSTWRSLLPTDTSKFYRYHGSMILPPCHESVQWIVFKEKLKLGFKQLKRLEKFKFSSKNLIDGREINWSSQRRHLQPVNGRQVERSFTLRKSRGEPPE